MAITFTNAELREDLKREQARATRLEARLRQAQTEIATLKTARDAALKVAAWGGPRRVEVDTRGEH